MNEPIIYISPYQEKDFSTKSSSLEIQNKMAGGVYSMLQEHYDVVHIIIPSREPKSSKFFFKTVEVESGYILGYINMFFLKQVSLAWSLYRLMKKKKYSNKIIIGYNFGPTLLGVTFGYNSIVKKQKNKLGVFFLDPPQIYPYFSGIKNFLIKVWNKLVKTQLNKLDFGISVSPQIVQDFLPLDVYKCSFPLWTTIEKVDENVVSKENKHQAVFAGNLDYHNDIDLLLEAFSKHLPNYNLIIFGKGRLEKRVMDYSFKYSNIEYKGLVSQETIQEYYQNSSLLLAPRSVTSSRDQYLSKYGVSSKLSELLLTGKPVLTRNIPAIPKNIEKILFYYTDLDTFVNEIKKIDQDYDNVIKQSYENSLQFRKKSDIKLASKKLKNFLERV